MLNYKQYEPYGETMLDTFGLTRQSYIGKEKEPENNPLYLTFPLTSYVSLSEILNPLFRGTLK
ncbi:MAG: hypothetical protein M9949_14880 [Candidatus Kapabacteria bacterium]|nr:hypothetical protein [Candidatus Kapabacteria bacterium]